MFGTDCNIGKNREHGIVLIRNEKLIKTNLATEEAMNCEIFCFILNSYRICASFKLISAMAQLLEPHHSISELKIRIAMSLMSC